MIKSLNKNDVKSTPFVAKKTWNVQNVRNENLILWISGSLSGPISHTYKDFGDGSSTPITNSFCNLALQQQPNVLTYHRGISGSYTFYPTSSEFYNSSSIPTNPDGTYMKVIYDMHKNMFYNPSGNPTQLFGLENINTDERNIFLTDVMDVFTFKKNQFGEKIVPTSLVITDTNGELEYTMYDDGNTNIKLSGSYFSKFQKIIPQS